MTVTVAMAPVLLADVVAPRASTSASARELCGGVRCGGAGGYAVRGRWSSGRDDGPRRATVAAMKSKNASNLPFLSIRCARIGGMEVPNQKRIEISLQYIHGIGKTSARQILLDTELENRVTKELSEEDLTKLRDEVAKYMIEGDLRRFNALAIKRLRDIQCYRGRRHIMGLPCRGQHTKCNARTRKGKKVTVAGKKKTPGK